MTLVALLLPDRQVAKEKAPKLAIRFKIQCWVKYVSFDMLLMVKEDYQ